MVYKKYLITGAYGFIGSHIVSKLERKDFVSIGLKKENDYQIDFNNLGLSNFSLVKEQSQFIIHLSSLAHENKLNNKDFLKYIKINYLATLELCKLIETWEKKPQLFIFLSSTNVYGINSGSNIDESYPLKGNSPFAISKIITEEFLINWGKIHGVKILILRLPLILGSSPPGNLKKLILAISKGRYFKISSGNTKKSMLNVDDLVNLILSNPNRGGIFNLTDGIHPSLTELENHICKQLNKKSPVKIPSFIVFFLSFFGDFVSWFPVNSSIVNKLDNELIFSDQNARENLNWSPKPALFNFKLYD